MSKEVFQNIVNDLKYSDEQYMKAKQMIRFSRNAGENTVKLESDLKLLEVKADKWREALRKEGIEVPKPE